LCGMAQTCVASPSTTTIVVDANSQRTAISRGIYGVALDNDDSMQVAALNRWGGDATSSYNWKNDLSNSGHDWNCANYESRFKPPVPDAMYTNSSDEFVHYNITKSADTLMTIPITGWVASMATPNPGNPNCAGGTAISSCCATLGTSEEELVDKGSSVLDTSFMGSWVQHLVSTFGSAANGGVRYYQLDNEPDNWQSLRTDVYPTLYPPGTSCEPFYTTNSSIGVSLNQDFINRTIAYAKAIKAADPTASVLFMSTENPEDLVALPNVECGSPAGPYSIGSWITSAYPGTGICISEYGVRNDGTNGGTPDATTGAQEADVLGMYGRLGFRVAAYWATLVNGTTHLPVYNAMAMYRNYDGKGGQFGPYSIGAASPNAGVNVYASSDSSTAPTKAWVMLVNVSGTAQSNLTIAVDNFTPAGSAQVYRSVAGAAPAPDTAATITAARITGFSLAANSIALLVLTK